MATDLGKVGIVMKGAWSNSVTYEKLDAVTYNNALYIASQDVPAGTLPTNTTYWQLSASIPANISDYAKSATITAGGTKTLTITTTTYSFFVYGSGWDPSVRSVGFLVSGYSGAASRSTITNLTGNTAVTIDNSDTTALNFIFSNAGSQGVTLYCLPLSAGMTATWS